MLLQGIQHRVFSKKEGFSLIFYLEEMPITRPMNKGKRHVLLKNVSYL